jgi:hypothetical protein
MNLKQGGANGKYRLGAMGKKLGYRMDCKESGWTGKNYDSTGVSSISYRRKLIAKYHGVQQYDREMVLMNERTPKRKETRSRWQHEATQRMRIEGELRKNIKNITTQKWKQCEKEKEQGRSQRTWYNWWLREHWRKSD